MQAVTTDCCCSDTVQQKFLSGFPVGEDLQTELECSRSVVLIGKFALLCCYVRVPTPAAMAASRRAFHHNAMRRPEGRRIFTIGQDE
jgi:hypothetical protein